MLLESLKARVVIGTNDRIKKAVMFNKDIYESPGHFIRCAIERELRRSIK